MIVATAGHVDHGKTALVRNLTGVETDRLEEEQRRGLSINLGYAYRRVDDETVLGFIDVPGHRRFINTMISGISGIDLGMLIVAADDGVMPQTLGHRQVMELLGVERYLLVVTKCDRVDDARVDEVCAAAAALLPRETPIHRVSNTNGAGIDALRAELDRMARRWPARSTAGQFRMSVDRAFHLKGHGLIVTGTIASGSVAVGDGIVLQPHGKALRVRSIHAQDTPASRGQAGERCALGVSGDVDRDDIQRGDWVAAPGCIDPASTLDARIRLLPEAPFALKHLTAVKLDIGAKHLEGRLMLIRDDGATGSRIHPGETKFARFVTDHPILCCRGDRFLLRDYGETAILGGGVVLDPLCSRSRRSTEGRLAFLAAMEHDDIEDAIRRVLDDAGALDYDALLASWNIDPAGRPGADLTNVARIGTQDGELWLSQSHWSDVKQTVLAGLRALHRDKPAEQGFSPTELALPDIGDPRLVAPALADLVQSGDIESRNGLLTARGHQATLSAQESGDWRIVSACLRKHGRQIPSVTQLEVECGIDKRALHASLRRAERDRRLTRINPKRYVEASMLNEFAQAALELTEDKRTLTVVECRDRLGCGRNVLIEVLEYFDTIGFTRRVGNARVILDRGLPERRFGA